MAKSLETWKNQVYGHTVDLDNGSYDCVDVSKSWVTYLTGKSWQEAAGWGNAKDIYYYWSATYLDRIPRGNAPKLGDIICMDGTIGGGYGHTGVIVAINGQNVTIYQQNSFTQQPVYTGTYNAYSSYIIGFLRPNAKAPFTVGSTPALQGFQRVVGPGGVHYRNAPNTSAIDLQPVFAAGEVLDFKGYVHGEKVDNNDVWFVGRYTGGYSWSGGFTDTGTHDLADLTAPAPLLGYQRKVGNSVINYRKAPEVMPDNVIKTFNPGDVLDFDAWTHGALVDATDVWFRGKYTGGWAHAGGFTDQTTHDLTEVKVVPVPVPVEPTDYSKKVVDLSSNNKIADWDKLKAAVRGVIHKAGHTGVSYGGIQPNNSDPQFATAKTKLGDKLVGAYWYGYASLDPVVEAMAFVQTVGAVPANFTYWLDIEELDDQTDAQMNAWCKKFLAKVDSLTNKVCGIYMNRDWYNNHVTSDTKGTRPIWLAHYGTPEFSNAVANQVAHQYTDAATDVPGMNGAKVDVSAVNDAFFLPTVIQPPVDPVDPNTPVDPTPVDPTQNPLWKVFVAFVEFLKSIIDKLTPSKK
jgi:GH25 family lysozyme M1 (1,4-beta-N-acetylmuramidase)